MAEIQQNLHTGTDAAPFRIDPKLHQILYKKEAHSKLVPNPDNVLPEPVYPQKPDPVEMSAARISEAERDSHLENLGRALFQIALA